MGRVAAPRPPLTPERREARDAMVSANVGLVYGLANKLYRSATIKAVGTLDDVVQTGFMGLIYAAERFDPSRGLRFSTYATCCVRGYILSASRSAGLIHVPAHVRRWLTRGERADMTFGAADALACQQLANVDERPGPGDVGPDLEEIHVALSRLTPRERSMVVARYGLTDGCPQSYRAVGQAHGCSGETARLEIRRALTRLRGMLATAA